MEGDEAPNKKVHRKRQAGMFGYSILFVKLEGDTFSVLASKDSKYL
jgi:hypothetical protein